MFEFIATFVLPFDGETKVVQFGKTTEALVVNDCSVQLGVGPL